MVPFKSRTGQILRSSEDPLTKSLAVRLPDIRRRSIRFRQTMALDLTKNGLHPLKTQNEFSQTTSNYLSTRFFGWVDKVASCLVSCCRPLGSHGDTLIRSQLDPYHILHDMKEREDASLTDLSLFHPFSSAEICLHFTKSIKLLWRHLSEQVVVFECHEDPSKCRVCVFQFGLEAVQLTRDGARDPTEVEDFPS
jgi:hypothetical protein